MDYHPLLDSFAILLISSIVIGFTSPSSNLRVGLLPVLSFLSWHCTLACPQYIPRSAWASSVGGYTLSLFLHYLDVAVLSQWSFDLQGPAKNLLLQPKTKSQCPSPKKKFPSNDKSPAQSGSIVQRFRYGLSVCFSWRFINTPYQAQNISRLDPKLSRSRKRFLASTGLSILVCYLILNGMDFLADPEITAKFYSVDRIPFFSRLTLPKDDPKSISLEELGMRFSAAIAMGASLISVQRGVYNICAFVSVLIGLSEPDNWPPFNGPFKEIVSLRKFWSVFWHQINTHRLRVISNFLWYQFFGFPRDVKPVRYMRPLAIFFVSGLLHVAIDVSSGMYLHESGAMRFFLIQPLGLMMEDAILGAYYNFNKQPATMAHRLLGMLWVGMWMAWTAPSYLYPVLAKADSSSAAGMDRVVPFSIIDWCVKGCEIMISNFRGTGIKG
ncbi:membrane bound O-acyl transferase family-domain-containing protein [Rhypophila decipiens]|uniref:Membrane bound O-acyl transferase family-domain-containing protein n=1 Tax=Rhypophila decipiens TaxID=261697 RepID=A0AAN7B6R5_9PEZI|nr:membrane bound O-acyl transferase family-domain-containing protein [Rhypophila decipiens]